MKVRILIGRSAHIDHTNLADLREELPPNFQLVRFPHEFREQ
ncbi:hypothetical protein [Nitrospira sp. KM1]|nr:hypothetical protein [Nitrospira sp. KM1]